MVTIQHEEKRMKTFSTVARAGALAVAVLLLAGSSVSAQSKTLVGNSVTASVTIVAIEQSSRTLTVKTEKGTYETIQAPPEVKRFSELKVGDKITARYYENVVVRLKKPDEAAVDVEGAAAVRGTGASPAAAGAVQRTLTVTITAKDPATSSVTVNAPNGYAYSRKVADKKIFDTLKVGDRLDMTWTDALLLSVEPASK
jgi:hypothetical protein